MHQDPDLRCGQCGGVMEVRYIGEMRDKRAVCPYCGTEVNLPDTFRRVERTRDREEHPWGSRSVETVQVETRSDHGPGVRGAPLAPEIDELRERLRERGAHFADDDIDEVIRELGRRGYTVSTRRTVSADRQVSVPPPAHSEPPGFLDRLLSSLGINLPGGSLWAAGRRGLFGWKGVRSRRRWLTPEEIVELAGGGLPPEERRNCPKCDAVVSRKAKRCPWCGFSLK
jgi:RNA polymerase subunit RPABC4/transcription elongation factor Spt4